MIVKIKNMTNTHGMSLMGCWIVEYLKTKGYPVGDIIPIKKVKRG